MEKHTVPKTYRLGDKQVEVMPYFLYNVSVYKITKDVASLLFSQFYKSDKALNIKREVTSRKYKGYSIVRYIDILGVTKEFVEENNLPLYEIKKKSLKRKKK